jgi:hypothetical protein
MSRRLAPLAFVVLAAVPAAQAKAPPEGVKLCGAASACVSIGWQDAERMPIWHADRSVAPAAPAPFYVVHYRWGATQPEQRMYWIPSRGVVRESTSSLVRWFRVAPSSLEPFTAPLRPIAVPRPTRVTVAGRAVRAPATYLRLFSVGRPTNVFPAVQWLRLRFTASAASPWTEPGADVQISTSGGYLLRDNTVFVISSQLASRVRRGLSLGR